MITTQRILTPEMVASIEALAPRYPNRRALTLPALHIVNDELRYVPYEAVVEVAQLLGLAPAEVQDTLSFYQFFPQDKPSGETRAWVCRSISCALRGGEEILDHICHAAGIDPYGTTADGALTVEPAECLEEVEPGAGHVVADVVAADAIREFDHRFEARARLRERLAE